MILHLLPHTTTKSKKKELKYYNEKQEIQIQLHNITFLFVIIVIHFSPLLIILKTHEYRAQIFLEKLQIFEEFSWAL